MFLGLFKIHKISAIFDFNLQLVISSKILSKNSKSYSAKSSNIADLQSLAIHPASYGSFRLPGFKAIEQAFLINKIAYSLLNSHF